MLFSMAGSVVLSAEFSEWHEEHCRGVDPDFKGKVST